MKSIFLYSICTNGGYAMDNNMEDMEKIKNIYVQYGIVAKLIEDVLEEHKDFLPNNLMNDEGKKLLEEKIIKKTQSMNIASIIKTTDNNIEELTRWCMIYDMMKNSKK